MAGTDSPVRAALGKVPEVTLGFWLIKIIATTLGETGADAVTMGDDDSEDSIKLGYATGTAIFSALFFIPVAFQIATTRFRPFLFWFVIIATTTVGTALADLVDRSGGLGYLRGSSLLFALVLATLATWRLTLGSVSIESITTRKAEAFYWLTIFFSQTLGTALGDWMAAPPDDGGVGWGYEKGALIFAGGLVLVAVLYRWTKVSHAVLFWAAFVLTRPLGATLGDLLDKSHDKGGLELSRYTISAVLAVAIVLCVALIPQRASARRA